MAYSTSRLDSRTPGAAGSCFVNGIAAKTHWINRRWRPPRTAVTDTRLGAMLPLTDTQPLRLGETGERQPADPVAGPVAMQDSLARDMPAAVAETADGANIQVLELRGTIIRLREQLDRIHMSYEEKVQKLESMHRAQRRDLEDTIRHLRDRLQAATGRADGG